MNGREKGWSGCRAILALVWLAFAATPARGLTDEEIFRGFQFNAIPPGARALGMGGAFVAIAGDASAADWNPAGLSSIAEPLLQVEYGSVRNESDTFQGREGNLDVNPVTGDRNLPFLSLSSSRSSERAQVPALLGFSWPFKVGQAGRRIAVGVSRQVGYSEDVSLNSGGDTGARFSFDTFPNTVNGNQVEAYSVSAPVSGSLSGEIVSWNAVFSAEVHPDFSVGVTLTDSTMDMQASTLVRVDDPLQILASASHPRLPAQSNTDVYRTQADGSHSDFAYAVGVLWHPRSAFISAASPWQFGATYRKGASFGVEESTTLNGLPDRNFENRFSVPDVYGVGVSYRSEANWTAGAEVDRVEYSDLLDGFHSGVSYMTGPHLATGAFSTRAASHRRFWVDDGNVVRLGGEYVLPVKFGRDGRVAVRAGWFRTPDMQIRMTGFNSTDPAVNNAYKDAFPEGSAENHLTLGAGVTWQSATVQLAWESSDISSRLLAAFTYGFGRK